MNSIKSTQPHPLESIAWRAFKENDHQDGTSLGYFMAGTAVKGGDRAYRIIALDVLGYMEDQGLLTRDSLGWWRPVAKR